MAENEDIPYNVSPFATAEDEKEPDEDQHYKGVLLEVQKYLSEAIDQHNTFDVIEPQGEGVMTTQQQVQMHKQVVAHLRGVKTIVDNKLKELE